MSPEVVIDLFAQALMLVIMMVCVLVVPGLIVGLVISTFQAATQINEATLQFVPKLVVMFLVLILIGPWMLQYMIDYIQRLFGSIPQLIG